LIEVRDGVWTDSPDNVTHLLGVIQEQTARYGIAPKRLILCATAPCAEQFRLRPLGVTYGSSLVIIGPKGLNQTILGHEFSHVALHQHYGLSDILSPRFPAWFDEGLAVWRNPDPRYIRPETAEQAQWIKAAQTYLDWGERVNAETWPQAYGAAARLVEEIEAQIGADGLDQLIAAVTQGADFQHELSRLQSLAVDPKP
jgi:hypothetical protein